MRMLGSMFSKTSSVTSSLAGSMAGGLMKATTAVTASMQTTADKGTPSSATTANSTGGGGLLEGSSSPMVLHSEIYPNTASNDEEVGFTATKGTFQQQHQFDD